jgi:hypothetical protein
MGTIVRVDWMFVVKHSATVRHKPRVAIGASQADRPKVWAPDSCVTPAEGSCI